MKKLYILIVAFIMCLIEHMENTGAASLKCADDKPIVDLTDHKDDADNSSEHYEVKKNHSEENKNALNKLFQNIQCTLEKAKPWMAELQQEAKRLEEAAKLLGLGILNSFGEFVDKLVEETAAAPTTLQTNSTINEHNAVNLTDIVSEEISQILCPEGFIADHNGICERIE